MKQTLIINLDKNQNPYTVSSIAATLKYLESTQVHLLTLESFKDEYASIKEIQKIYVLNDQELKKLLSHRIYSSFQALDKMIQFINEINENNYYNIINLSNSELAAWISSSISQKTVGITKTNLQTTNASNIYYWLNQDQNYLNQKELLWSALDLADSRCRFSAKDDKEIEEFTKNLFKFYKHESNIQKKLIGIEVSGEEIVNALSIQTLKDFAEELIQNKNLVPVFLVNRGKNANKLAFQLHEEFDRRALIINLNARTAPFILKELNLVLSCSHNLKDLADELSLPQIWITTNHQSTFTSHPLTERSIVFNTEAKYIPLLNSKDLVNLTNYILTNKSVFEEETESFISLNEVVIIENKPILLPLNSNFIASDLYSYVFENCYWLRNYGKETKGIDKVLKLVDSKTIHQISESHRTNLEEILALCLNSLRTLKASRNNKFAAKEFYQSVDALMSYSGSVSIARSLISKFKFDAENISGNSLEENIQKTEHILLEMKNRLSDGIFLVDRLLASLTPVAFINLEE